ncbi:ketoacyl-ACP synthase III family protein [Streptomyces sediminimaris]|uniref:ketoacyl-ACP synthase III family protein n=1 Tax=Streptomyces sediminimaris TaxID=3383721 RepID=UPI0039996C66
MRVRDVFLSGIGVHLPDKVESIDSAVTRGLFPADEVEARGYTGALVAGETPPPEMALNAARDALKNGGVSPQDLAALLYAGVWHQGPDGWGPQYYLQRHLVGDELLAVEIRHGCNGTFSGIELAVGILRSAPENRAALVTASDNFGTRLFRRWDSGAQNSVMGDGAAAVVLTKDQGFARLLSVCTASYSELEEADRAGEPLFPPGITEGRVLDYKTRYAAYGRKLLAENIGPELLVEHARRNTDCLNRALAEAEVTADDIKRVLIHNVGKGDAATYLNDLGFPMEMSAWDYGAGIGHIGAGDHLISLHHLLRTGQLQPGDHVLLAGMSPGVTYKAAVVKILDVPSWA